jgi:hypothetical protein
MFQCFMLMKFRLNILDSFNTRVLYCDRHIDSPKHRPIRLSSPFSSEAWFTIVFLIIFGAVVSSFEVFRLRSAANKFTTVNFIKNICNNLLVQFAYILEKDLGKKSSTKAFIGLIAICLGNTYKNYLTIELVFPRAQNAIQNVTELLDLNFNVLEVESVNYVGVEKSSYLQSVYYHLEIDEVKREKNVREVDRWLRLVPDSNWTLIMYELVSATKRNAWILSAPYHFQMYLLNIINEIIYPLSCYFVKRPFAHQFKELYFLNPKV